MRPTNWSEYLEASFTADTDSRRIAEGAFKMRSGPISHWIRMLQIFGGRRRSAASQQYQIKAHYISRPAADPFVSTKAPAAKNSRRHSGVGRAFGAGLVSSKHYVPQRRRSSARDL